MIDVELIERGAQYRNLNDSYVIFFMLQDLFGRNAPIYEFENLCMDYQNLSLGDGTKKIFVNAAGIRDILNPELRSLLDYMCGQEPSSALTNKIEREITQLKRNERWKGEYMTLYEHYQIERSEGREEGRAEGRAEGRIAAVDAVVEKLHMTVEQACEVLNCTIEEYNEAKALIDKS